MFRGKLFHSVGAAAAKDLLPKYSNRHLGGVSRWFSVDRRVRFGEYGISSSRIYAGLVCEQKDFKINPLLHGEPMQINEDRGDVIVFAPFGPVMTRAAWFWRFWSWDMSCNKGNDHDNGNYYRGWSAGQWPVWWAPSFLELFVVYNCLKLVSSDPWLIFLEDDCIYIIYIYIYIHSEWIFYCKYITHFDIIQRI